MRRAAPTTGSSPKGVIENYDGHIITVAPALEGLDFNRNFPGATGGPRASSTARATSPAPSRRSAP